MDPVLVEVTRGARVESAHRGAVAVVDETGATVLALGDVERGVFPRSACKGIQALQLLTSGAADRFGLSDAELALACSSHNGEPEHVAAAASVLRRAGRDETCLECGAHWPAHAPAAYRLAAEGRQPGALHNNCSGKHAGFVATSVAQGHDPAGYVRPDHPTMRGVTAALSRVTGVDLDAQAPGVDGCSIPTFAVPLRALALAFARFATGRGLSAEDAAAAARLRAAVAANPSMVGGTERFDTLAMQAAGARAFVKGGAEGVHIAALPELGLGIAVKCDDGAGRASEVAVAAVMERFLPGLLPAGLRVPALRNWNGILVGDIRPSAVLAPPGAPLGAAA